MLSVWEAGGRRHGPSCAAAVAAGGDRGPGRRLGRGRPGGAQPAGELAAGQRERLGGAPRGGAGLRAHRPAPPRPHPGTVGGRAGTPRPAPPQPWGRPGGGAVFGRAWGAVGRGRRGAAVWWRPRRSLAPAVPLPSGQPAKEGKKTQPPTPTPRVRSPEAWLVATPSPQNTASTAAGLGSIGGVVARLRFLSPSRGKGFGGCGILRYTTGGYPRQSSPKLGQGYKCKPVLTSV